MKSGIYKITCIGNNKIYIGSAFDLNSRLWRHKDNLKNQKFLNFYMQRSYNKYGVNSFIFEVIERCGKNMLLQREQYHLDTLLFAQEYIKSGHKDKRFLKLGFNVNPIAGSSNGAKLSQSHINKVVAKNKGKKRTEEQKIRIREVMNRPEIKAKIMKALKLATNTPTCKRKRSNIAKKLWENPEYRDKVISSCKASLLNEDIGQKRTNAIKEYYKNNPNACTKMADRLRILSDDENYKAKVKAGLLRAYTPEVRERRSKTILNSWKERKGNDNSFSYRTCVICHSAIDGEIVYTFKSVTECRIKLRMSYKTIIKYIGSGKEVNGLIFSKK